MHLENHLNTTVDLNHHRVSEQKQNRNMLIIFSLSFPHQIPFSNKLLNIQDIEAHCRQIIAKVKNHTECVSICHSFHASLSSSAVRKINKRFSNSRVLNGNNQRNAKKKNAKRYGSAVVLHFPSHFMIDKIITSNVRYFGMIDFWSWFADCAESNERKSLATKKYFSSFWDRINYLMKL